MIGIESPPHGVFILNPDFQYDHRQIGLKEQVRNVRELVARLIHVVLGQYALATAYAHVGCWKWCWIEVGASDRRLTRKLKTGFILNPVHDQGLRCG